MYLKKAFKMRLHDNTWMDPITKNTAIEKLDKISEDIYDSKLTDYNMMSDLTNIYYENIRIINEFNFKINMMFLMQKKKLKHQKKIQMLKLKKMKKEKMKKMQKKQKNLKSLKKQISQVKMKGAMKKMTSKKEKKR